MQEVSITQFTIYYPYYKDKLSNVTRSFVFAANNLHFLCSLSNLSTALAYATEPNLVTKKRKSPRTSIHLFFDALQLLSLMLSLMISNMRPAIFEYLAISKYMSMSKWQFSSTLASFPLLADYSLIKLTSEASLHCSCTAQTTAQIVEFLPDANVFINKFRGLRHIKTQFANAMAYRFDIEKQHWGRYQIIETKLHQYK